MRLVHPTWIILLVFLSISCKKESQPPVIQGDVVYWYEYRNTAWGEAHWGWIADKSGNIYTFRLPNDWVYLNGDLSIASSDLQNNLQQCSLISSCINQGDWDLHLASVGSAITGEITQETRMADAGILTRYVLIKDTGQARFTAYILKQTGDIEVNNNSPSAASLADWLDNLHQKIWVP